MTEMTYNIITKSLPITHKVNTAITSGYPIYDHDNMPIEQGGRVIPTSPELKKRTPVLAYIDKLPELDAFISVKNEIYSVIIRYTPKDAGFCIVRKVKNTEITDKKQIGKITLIAKTENDIRCPYCNRSPVFKKTDTKKLNDGKPIDFTCKTCGAVLEVQQKGDVL